MRQVVSISLGSANRDTSFQYEIAGHVWELHRIGADGSIGTAKELLRHWDGRAAAIGLGGVNFAYQMAGRTYPIRLANVLASCVRQTPLVDGSRWKKEWEPIALQRIADQIAERRMDVSTYRALVVSALDREPLVAKLASLGCTVRVGDPYFALGLPWYPRVEAFQLAARFTLPLLSRLPMSWFYPLGDKQDRLRKRLAVSTKKRSGTSNLPGLIVGDPHLLFRKMPHTLRGCTFITGSMTREDAALLFERGLDELWLFAPPAANGRSLPANLWEALALASMRLSGQDSFMLSEGAMARWAEEVAQIQPVCLSASP